MERKKNRIKEISAGLSKNFYKNFIDPEKYSLISWENIKQLPIGQLLLNKDRNTMGSGLSRLSFNISVKKLGMNLKILKLKKEKYLVLRQLFQIFLFP